MPSRWQWTALCALIGIAGGAAALVVWKDKVFAPQVEVVSVEKMAFPLPDKPSIAVLPFRNISADPKQSYFSDGLTEEIIAGLTKFPSLFVVAHNSAYTYKGKNVKVQTVSEELGVRYVLEGSVRKVENRVRITVQLTDVIRGYLLWAESYDRQLKDIFSIQDEITIKILTALQVQLMAVDESRLLEKRTDNLAAYLKLLEGIGYTYEFSIDASLKCFEEARTLDPQFAEAYAREALAHLYNFLYGPSSNRWLSLLNATETARKCADIDDKLAACNMVLGVIYLVNREFSNAISEEKRAVERWPNSAEAAAYLALALQFSGRYEEAIREIERALRLNPLKPELALTFLGITYFRMGRYEDAITACKKVVELSPRQLPALLILALAYSSVDRKDEARSTIYKIRRIRPNFSAQDFVVITRDKTDADIDSILNELLNPKSKRKK